MNTLQFNKKKLPLILQQERAECGHACIAMIGNYLGHRLSLYAIRKINQPSAHGISLRGLQALCSQLTLTTRALQVPLEEFKYIQCPAILHWELNHFVVLKEVKNHRVVIYDPASGERCLTMKELSNYYTGIVLEVSKGVNFIAHKHQDSLNLRDFFQSVGGLHHWVVILFVLSFAVDLLQLINPLLIQYVTDHIIGVNNASNLIAIAAVVVFFMMMGVLFEWCRGNLIIYLSNYLTETIASTVMQHLLKLPLSYFETRHKGDIQSKFQSIDQIQKKITTDFISTVLDGFMISINLIIMLIYSQLLTAIVVISVVLYGLIRYASSYNLKKQTDLSLSEHARTETTFLETLQGILPIKSFLKESVRFNTWRNHYIDALNADICLSKSRLFYQISSQSIGYIEYLFIICLGVHLVLMHQISTGMFIAFLSFRQVFVNKAGAFIQSIFDYQLIKIQLNRLSDIVLEAEEVEDVRTNSPDLIKGSLVLKQINFSYPGSKLTMFHDLSFSINSGEKVAIIGPSGCGKTTLLKLMMGLLPVSQGELVIDGIPLASFGLHNYRQLTASVMQEDALFSGSIMDNIAFFDDEINPDRVYEVAKLAEIHDSILLMPMGYETMIGDMFSSLSGGQRQRILLARALYKKPKWLFLDEATSHLDVDCEKKINQALKALDITQIIIAHREESIKMADRIIELGSIH